MSKDKIIIFDTTLRDGEQSPGATMNVEEKILIADVLDEMGVDVIEAGFAISSKGDFEAINKIAKRAKNASICSLARAIAKDVEAAGEAVKPAKNPRIHTFISTSDIHLKYQFRKTREQVLEDIHDSVSLARKYTDNVEWSAMDATRSEVDYLCKAIEVAIKAGATTVNIPDTVGYAIPWDYANLIRQIKNKVPNIDKAIISVHCQNDLGLATANSLAALEAGARQIECTINGIGERAGNTSLEEVIMAIKTRQDVLPYKLDVKSEYIMRASKLVTHITGLSVQANKAIVGANAFAHESGIHQDGVLKNPETYEIMKPESVGLVKNKLVMGKHSGRAAFKDKLAELSLNVTDEVFEVAFNKFKDLCDKKKEIFDEDIIAIVDERAKIEGNERIEFVSMEVKCGTTGPQKAKVTIKVDKVEKTTEAEGQGPIDAIFSAIKTLTGQNPDLVLYDVSAVTEGIDSQAEVLVRLRSADGVLINGSSADVDTTVASARAYIAALNRLSTFESKSLVA